MIIHGKQNINFPKDENFGRYMFSNLRKAREEDVCLENGITRETLTYRQATKYAVNLSVGLSNLGVKRGDVVAIGSEAYVHYVPTMLAITFTGAAYTAYHLEIGRAVLKHKLQLVKPKYFICSALFWQAYSDVLRSADCIQTYISVSDIVDIPCSVNSILAVDVDLETFEPKEVEGKTDTVLILYSSGTTGLPKGVEISHSSCILTCIPDAFRQRPSLQTAFMAGPGPWFHNMFAFKTFEFLLLGRKIVFTTDLSIRPVLTLVRDCKVDVMFTTPAYIRNLAASDEPVGEYFNFLKMIYCRSSPLREHTIKVLKERFPKVEHVIQAMGLTECGEPMSQIWAQESVPGSVGAVAPGVQVKIVDPNTRTILGPNERGEICVKGNMIMKGYLRVGNDSTDYLDEEGYYKTGDLGYFDEKQYFYIIDRLTDMIHLHGRGPLSKVSPVEVENVLLQHPAVQDAGVAGKPLPPDLVVLVAFVVIKPGSNVTDSELIGFIKSEGSLNMQLHGGVRFISEIPRNQRGKILRRKLIEMLDE